ncbi:MAG: glycoside hydrolase family 97 protein [Bacteroidales bacterium]
MQIDDNINWSLKYGDTLLVEAGLLSFVINDDNLLKPGIRPVIELRSGKTEIIENPVPAKFRNLQVTWNQMELSFENNLVLEFRVYNEGFAYRYILKEEKEITVNEEQLVLTFPDHCRILFPREDKLQSHYERMYLDTKLMNLDANSFASLPLLVQTKEGINILITDADLYDYPCMFLQKADDNSLHSLFPKAILETRSADRGSDRNEVITKEASFIAKTFGNRTFPWRVFIIAKHDKELLENQLVYNLSRQNQLNFDWVKPGKVAWDWWNDNNIHGVDFQSGINTETYRYYIDFAADYGLEYIILDEGWSKTTLHLLESNPALDIQELVDYAKIKNVGVILWVLWKPFYENMERVLNRVEQWGIAGIKVDFMQRADQQMVNIYEEIAIKAAEHKMLVDFHGAFKPSGLSRAYPNVLTYEGVKGLENTKWSYLITPAHNLTLPFTRMVAGPMDYTPGAMINKQKENFAISWNQPMSMGTRAHQVALFVVFESPLQMLSDNPSNYRKEDGCTRFISQIPTVWDHTIAIDGRVGEYLVIARKHRANWYVAALTDWAERTFEIDLDFLDDGIWDVEILQDGVNANKHAEDYKSLSTQLKNTDRLKIEMAKGGGYTAVFTPCR